MENLDHDHVSRCGIYRLSESSRGIAFDSSTGEIRTVGTTGSFMPKRCKDLREVRIRIWLVRQDNGLHGHA